MLVGVQDPIALLAKDFEEWDIAVTVIEKARERQDKARGAEMNAIVTGLAKSIGNEIAKHLAAMFR